MNKQLLLTGTCTLIFLTLLVSKAYPKDKTDSYGSLKDTIGIREVIVTGTRAEVLKTTVAQSVTVIEENDIRSSTESNIMPILSNQVPGMFVSNFGVLGYGVGTQSTGQINMRGVGGKPTTQALILIDGHPQYMGIFGHPIPDAYVTSDISRVEVIRGPASLLYGSNAMGGVINIITRDQEQDGSRIGAEASYGSFNTQKYMLNGGFKKDKFSVFASASRNTTDGHLDSSNFERWNGNLKLGYAFNENWKLSAAYNLTDFQYTFPPSNQSTAFISDINRGRASLSLQNKYENTSGGIMAFYNYGRHDLSDGWLSDDRNAGIMIYQSLVPFEGNQLTVGMDYKNFGGKGSPVMIFQRDDDGNVIFTNGAPAFGPSPYNDKWTSIDEYALYAVTHQQLMQSFFLNAGIRLENNSVYGTEWVPQAGLSFHPAENTILKASTSKGFRSPTIQELYLFPVANEELMPEKMWNYDLSLLQSLWDSRISVEITGFYTQGDNIIQMQSNSTPPPPTIRGNSGSFENKGLEGVVKVAFNEHSRWHVNYTYIDSDRPVLYTPGHKLFTSFNQRIIGGLRANLSLNYVGGLYTQLASQNASAIKEDYLLLNAGLKYNAIPDYLDVYLRVKNILNTEYQMIPGYDMPAAHFDMGLKFRLQ